MKKTLLTSVLEAYEPPYADIIEFAVEGGFSHSKGFETDNGTEDSKRVENNEANLWGWME